MATNHTPFCLFVDKCIYVCIYKTYPYVIYNLKTYIHLHYVMQRQNRQSLLCGFKFELYKLCLFQPVLHPPRSPSIVSSHWLLVLPSGGVGTILCIYEQISACTFAPFFWFINGSILGSVLCILLFPFNNQFWRFFISIHKEQIHL